MVSVIIPTYNRAQYISMAINSVLWQTHCEFEIIIIDDGSSDNTADIIGEYIKNSGGKIRYFYQNNSGCASARNKGVILSVGNYISFLDSDDWYMDNKLSIESSLLNLNPGASFVYSRTMEFSEESNESYVSTVAAQGMPSMFAREHFLTLNARICAFLFRKEIFQRIKFRTDLYYNEDSDFIQKVALNFKGVYSPYVSSCVRSHEAQKSKNRVSLYYAVLRSSDDILTEYADFQKRLGIFANGRLLEIKIEIIVYAIFERNTKIIRKLIKGVIEDLYTKNKVYFIYLFFSSIKKIFLAIFHKFCFGDKKIVSLLYC